MMEGSQTQQSTQLKEDPRRLGRNNSGLCDRDIPDVFCILHPGSPAAYRIVAATANRDPRHVLQNEELLSDYPLDVPIEEQETFKIEDHQNGARISGLDLALRFSTKTREPWTGVVFGRNPGLCDIVITVDSVKRVSNRHFRIYVNDNGIVMLEDMSTNGTMIDDHHLKARSKDHDATRMLHAGAIIQIISTKQEEVIKFIVRLPTKDGHHEAYTQLFQQHMRDCHNAWQEQLGRYGQKADKAKTKNLFPVAHSFSSENKPLMGSAYTHGMHWNGGTEYNVIGLLGKGAFATVYKLATAKDGTVVAAKELEKKRFMRNGRLDRRLDNEMQIMQTLRHDNIVGYEKYHDIDDYLYIIMEFVPFGDLQGLLHREAVLPEYKAKLMAKQVLKALEYLHKKRITHRDIKPDNILIASLDPFEVKLTDFGLSKVVEHEETFLKTFCGTLLYCAPEVFPHFTSSGHGTKRRRGVPAQKTHHAYSQSVDVWSFAAVLWTSLAGVPPFEGKADQTGKAMFDNIMTTELDPLPLRARFVSEEAIDLLMQMLNRDPAERPTEAQCLRHPWFGDQDDVQEDMDLHAIQEEDESEMPDQEDDIEDDEEVEAGAQQQLSQLSIRDNRAPAQQSYYDDEFDSADLESLLDPRASKRIKSDRRFPRNQTRSPPELESGSFHEGRPLADSPTMGRRQLGRPQLFGEIGQSALHSSGVLEEKTQKALLLRDASTSMEESSEFESASFADSNFVLSANGGSILANTSALRNLDIAAASPGATSEGTNEPSTPKTPDLPITHSISDGSDHVSQSTEETPKAPGPQFSRRIQLPRSASSYYDPLDPSTHNLEHASRVSGYDFVQHATLELARNQVSAKDHSVTSQTSSNGSMYGNPPSSTATVSQRSIPLPGPSSAESHVSPNGSSEALYPLLPNTSLTATSTREESPAIPIPDTIRVSTGSLERPDEFQVEQQHSNSEASDQDSQFVKPFPRLGRLTGTQSSCYALTINLERHQTSFGRNPGATVVHQPITETRVPKVAFIIWFHHPDLQRYIDKGEDWSQLPGLKTGITTFSAVGIWVNNVRLRARDENGHTQYGHIHHGDVVTAFKDTDKREHLAFGVEIFKGQGAVPRPAGQKFVILKQRDTSTAAAIPVRV